jgi:phosphate transport system permease protein
MRTVRARKIDWAFRGLTALCALVVLLLMGGIFVELARHSRLAVREFGLQFLVRDEWNPVIGDFGALSSVVGTLVSTALALLIAAPLSLVIALFLVEMAPPMVGRVVGGGIELLAAIPSIIYGMWGLFVFAPFMADYVQPFLADTLGRVPLVQTLFSGPPMGIGMLTAGIVLALMILPFISAVMRDVLHMVPAVTKEAAYGVGATTWEVTRRVSLRYGLRGMVGAVFLGAGRALGETMAVTFVIGNDHGLSASLFGTGNTIASTLACEFNEASDLLHASALVTLGLILFLVTVLFQVAAQVWLSRLHRKIGGGV